MNIVGMSGLIPLKERTEPCHFCGNKSGSVKYRIKASDGQEFACCNICVALRLNSMRWLVKGSPTTKSEKTLNANKAYRVELSHWKNGSGWSHSETFDHVPERCTAEEYIRSLDCELQPPIGCDDTKVAIFDGDTCISEAWASEVNREA